MKWPWAIVWMGVVMSEAAERIPVTMREDRAYVAASGVEQHWEVAVKILPGDGQVVACFRDRCAVVKDHVRIGSELWVGVESVTGALSLRPDWSADRATVGLAEDGDVVGGPVLNAVTGPGDLAPNFRLRRLDGKEAIALGDLRGKRVLINSWASW